MSCEAVISCLLVAWMLTALAFALSFLRNEKSFSAGYARAESDQRAYQKVIDKAREYSSRVRTAGIGGK